MSGFDDLFMRATGTTPFPYQRRLAASSPFPDVLEIPTGAGKTAAAIVSWLYRRRFAGDAVARTTPRRLVFCLPMRTLVEQVGRVASDLTARLGLEREVPVSLLLGGSVDDSWEARPDGDAILVGTQDQLLSRALNRGYGMSRYRWPVHFALLNDDCLWILDEVQLMGPGLSTSAQLQAFREAMGTYTPSRSLWMSATFDGSRLATVDLPRATRLVRLQLGPDDQDHPDLALRLAARKPIRRAGSVLTDGDARPLSSEILAAHVPGSLTLVVVNRVARAQELYRALRARSGDTPVRLLHSRFRPCERRPLQDEVLRPGWSGILVSTQAIEAGVDLSSRTLFTELAPWSSMVQRFGRCNRRGELGPGQASVVWIDVPDDEAAPYDAASLARARAVLDGLGDGGPASLAALTQEPQPPQPPVLRRRDLLELFDTQPDLAGHDLDVSRFVRSTDDRDVQVAWRQWPDGEAPPSDMPDLSREELCTAPISSLEKMKGLHAYRWVGRRDGRWERIERPVPGMTVVLRTSDGGYDRYLGWTGKPSDRAEAVPAHGSAPESDEDEPLSVGCAKFVTLATHASDVAEELRALRASLGGDLPWEELERAARWHDLGKVHPAFQEMLVGALPDDDPRRAGGPWAKSDGRRGPRNPRRFFRHELASALALLAGGGSDLEAYVIASHHGKVRMSLRARPLEPAAPDGRRFALGVWDGDVLPTSDLGEGVRSPETTLSLEIMELGDGGSGPSWAQRTRGLLERLGPFRLALLETLVRVSDWRGTARWQAPR